MYTDESRYILTGIWISGIVFVSMLVLGLIRMAYNTLIRPWRLRHSKLTLDDLRNRRRFAANKEGIVMKLLKLTIWISGLAFAGLMAMGIALSIRFNFNGAPIKKIFLAAMDSGNVNLVLDAANVDKTLQELGVTKEEVLNDVTRLISQKERERASISPDDEAVHAAEYESLCLLRDILEGKVTRGTAPNPIAQADLSQDNSKKAKKKKDKKRKKH